MTISVIIKALNEEKKIENCILSILNDISVHLHEIILVDSCSSDNTIAIANKYPIKIVQFTEPDDANCGAAVELGFQVSSGDYIYIIDGDMTLKKDFLKQAFLYLKTNPNVAGVSGLIEDTLVKSFSDRRRQNTYNSIKHIVNVTSLGGGGLYRKDAITSVGYLGHSGLESCEELELGARLLSKGWLLCRLPVVSVSHTGHGLTDFSLLYKYFKANRFLSIGKAFKASWISHSFFIFAGEFKYLWVSLFAVFLSVMLSLTLSLPIGVGFWFFILFSLYFILAVRKRSFFDPFISLVTWHLTLYQVLIGLFRKLKSPYREIQYRLIKDN